MMSHGSMSLSTASLCDPMKGSISPPGPMCSAFIGSLYRAETLYLLNDSVIGPVSDQAFHTTIARLREAPADFSGMTESHEGGWHIQSYFLALKQSVMRHPSWQHFLLSIVSLMNKDDVINAYEMQLTPTLKAAGLSTCALFTTDSRSNPTIVRWRELLYEGFPFIKTAIIRDRIPGVDNAGWREVLHDIGFDTSIVDRVLVEHATEHEQESRVHGRGIQPTTPAIPRRPLRLAFIGPWNYDNGLGFGARGYLSALMRTGYEINFLPIVRPFHTHHRITPTIECSDFVGPADVAVLHLNPEAWDVLLTETQREIFSGALVRISAVIWESSKLPGVFHRRLGEVDAAWVPSSYCAEIFRSASDFPVHTIRFPVVTKEKWHTPAEIASIREWLGLEAGSKVILFAFNSSSSIARKNPFALVAAFEKAGLASAGWRLILKTKLSSDDKANSDLLRAKVAECPGCILIDRPLGGEAMASLINLADIYASPHSSEGFGLSIAEAMAMGKAVVATDFGGSRDFLDCETGFPVRWSPWRLDEQEGPYVRDTRWARIDEMHLAERLTVAANLSNDERRSLGLRARGRVQKVLSPEAVAAEMRTSISSLMETRRVWTEA